MPNVHKLSPFAVSKVWGGQRLSEVRKLTSDGPIGETWEISTHPDGPCFVGDTELAKVLGQELSYLVKFIDTSDNLSVQVHPGDDYAQRVENSSGKTECWLILDAAPGAGIYLGLNAGVTKERFKSAIDEKKNLSELMRFFPVKPGDFFFVPAGSIHAIGENVFLAEVQQSSGITYRVWDWNRLGMDGKPRELHIQKALDVVNFSENENSVNFFQTKENLLDSSDDVHLASHSHFQVELISCGRDLEKSLTNKTGRACSFLCLEGDAVIEGQYELEAYQAALVETKKGETISLSSKSSAKVLFIS